MGDQHNSAGEIGQMVLQPSDGFGIEMVGRLIQQQQVRFFEQQFAQGDAALFTA